MGTKVSKTAIGAFVLGAIVLLVATVLILGAGKLFTAEHTYITYFTGSVKGLAVGSPVMFRGVRIGSVTDISITVNPATSKIAIPVTFNLEPAKFKGTREAFQRDPKTVEKAVKELGLRSQLQTMSFVTGQLMVGLDFFPGTPASYVGLNKDFTEIPSVPTPLEQLQKTLEDLPFKQIVENLNSAMDGIQRLVGSIDMKKTTERLDASMRDLQTLIRNVNNQVDPLMRRLSSTSQAAEATMNEATGTLSDARGHMDELVATTKTTLDAAKVTLDSAQSTLKQSEQTLQDYGGDSQIHGQMNRTLRELAATSRSLRQLSDYLERHPESLLRGKRD
jgi:paraquat-inducible protein B